jgi:hypothetical protein
MPLPFPPPLSITRRDFRHAMPIAASCHIFGALLSMPLFSLFAADFSPPHADVRKR